MKTNRMNWVLLFLMLGVAASFQLHAQQNEFDRKLIEEIKAKAEKGDAQSQFELGAAFYFGNLGVPKDAAEAVNWFRKAAKKGHVLAQNNLGLSYSNGDGTPTNAVEAVVWFRKAAEQGLAEAQFNLARSYDTGTGVAQDSEESLKLYRGAASQGLDRAQWMLGMRYQSGIGVPQDYVEAHKVYNLASAQGLQIATTFRKVVEYLMTPEQIAEAQKLARDFKPKQTSASRTLDSNPTRSGTGFFITDDGFLVTNAHVVKEAAQVRLVTSAGLISAKVVKVDAANDLALLKTEGRFAALPVAASRAVKLGGTVATVGFPNIGLQGFAPKLAKGEIASLSGAGDDARYFQISVPVQPGNSGGALVDERGNVVGVVSAKLSARAALAASGALPENVNYAVKSSYLLSFLESVPEVSAKLKEPETKERKFEDVVKSAEQAAVLVLVY